LAFQEERGGFSLTLKRNCSISPSGLACVFVALAVAVLAIGTGFAIAGAWLVLAVSPGSRCCCSAERSCCRRATPRTTSAFALERGRLKVEVADGRRLARYEARCAPRAR